MAETQSTVSALNPQTARKVLRWLKDEWRGVGNPTNPISGRWVSQTHCFAKITGSTTSGTTVLHAWTEVRWNLDTKVWEDVPDGREGTSNGNYVINLADATETLEDGKYVEICKCSDPQTGESFWIGGSSAALPVGQYVGMSWNTVAANEGGFAYPFSVTTV